MRARRRSLVGLVALSALALVGPGCADDDPSEEASTTTTSGGGGSAETATTAGGGELTATARGVTADTITIGYSYLDFDALVEQGLAAAGFGDQELAFQTV